MKTELRCGFCYDREQGKHGEIKREPSIEWGLMIPVCRKHSFAMEKANTEADLINAMDEPVFTKP